MTRYRTTATTQLPQTSRQIICPWQKTHAVATRDLMQKVWQSFNAEKNNLMCILQWNQEITLTFAAKKYMYDDDDDDMLWSM